MQIDFEALFAKSPNPYVILDRDLRLAWMNDAYLAVTMREREDLIGKGMFEAFPSDPDSESFWQLNGSFERVLETGEPDEIALIRYDIRRPDGRMDVRYWSATHTPLKDSRGETAFILQHTVDVTELHSLRRLRDEMGVVARASAVEARNRDLQHTTQRMIAMFEQAPGFVALLSGPDHRFEMTNEAYRELVGRENLKGKSIAEALPEVIEQGFIALLDRVYHWNEPFVGRRARVTLNRGADTPETRFVNFIYQPISDDEDRVTGIMVQGYDVTEEVEYEERQALLINELNHRVKNTLAIVQGLAGQSFSKVENAGEARKVFDARLRALAAAHNLLTESNWSHAGLCDLVQTSVEATAGEAASRIHVSGHNISLPPQTGVSLTMIVHELMTNALKYGALSNDEGQVHVEWSVEGLQPEDGEESERRLVIDWRETDGPPVAAPTRRGFGTRLIARGLSSERGSAVEMDFAPDGLHCRITSILRTAS